MRLFSLGAPITAGIVLLSACGSSDTSSSTAGGGASSTTPSSAAQATFTCATGSLSASGSTALQPLVQAAVSAYQAKCPGATITVAGGGSSTGLGNVAHGISDIGNSDVPVSFAKTIDASTVTDHQVAVAQFAVIANPKTGVTNLTLAQIQQVFSGQVTNWKAVGGNDVPVTLIERKPGSGTRLTFDTDVMNGTTESATPAATQDSTTLVVQGVLAADGGVSYATVGSAGSLTIVTIAGSTPSVGDINSGKYPFFSHEHMYTKGTGSALAQDFINFMMSKQFEATVLGQHYVPTSEITVQSKVDKA
ncbi:MAG TPA: phosphate ABC transporter substrate-binding protein [Candidatus Dormibacteraeota bacterium]